MSEPVNDEVPFFITLQHKVPQEFLTRTIGKLAASEKPWLKQWMIDRFIKRYGVNMQEAQFSDATAYRSFNEFFTRALKPGVRPLHPEPDAVLCPADGVVSALGNLNDDSLIQAKGKSYTATALLGGDATRAAPFRDGTFATVYLSPKDYHRVHIPLTGTLREMIYVPGKLFSVNQVTADYIDNLFAINERVVCIFDTAHGRMAVVLVGAMIVAAIETVWAGRVAPAFTGITTKTYAPGQVRLDRGAELGRFLLGSTAIILFSPGMVEWQMDLSNGPGVKMGQKLGRLRDG
ncbi:MAG TPA: archaetidylserine decarboxylase [Candidatus Acidoferrum sp.]|nr:archaetidylserine decarboxylase [Candidatus Acidoferrum sp.]